jgi:hypothetical protein
MHDYQVQSIVLTGFSVAINTNQFWLIQREKKFSSRKVASIVDRNAGEPGLENC